ncbi:MAG: STAS domain-containing protein [Bacteroidota bacterium]
MRFEKSTSDNYITIKLLENKLDTRYAANLKSEFVAWHASGSRCLILNMSDVQYVDSSGLSAILTGNRLFESSNGLVVMCCLNDHVQKLVTISKLDSVLNILPTEEESREAIFMHILQSEIEDEVAEEGEVASSDM